MYKAVEWGYIRPYGPGTHWGYYPNYGKTFMDNEIKYSDGFADNVFAQDLWQDFEIPKYEAIVKYICENYYEYSIVYKKSVLEQVLKLKFDIEIDDLINYGITSQVYMDDNYIAFKAFGVGETYPETLTIVDSIEMINDNYAYCIWHRVDEKNINDRSDTIYGILEKGMVEGTSVVGYRYLSLTPPSDDIIGLYKNSSQSMNEHYQENDNTIHVEKNGVRIDFKQPPVMYNERIMVPVRDIFETLGASVDWNEATSTVTAFRDGVTMWFEHVIQG